MSTTARKARKRTRHEALAIAARYQRTIDRDPSIWSDYERERAHFWRGVAAEHAFTKPAKVGTPVLRRSAFWGWPLKHQIADLTARGVTVGTEQMKQLVDVDADRRRIARRNRRRSS